MTKDSRRHSLTGLALVCLLAVLVGVLALVVFAPKRTANKTPPSRDTNWEFEVREESQSSSESPTTNPELQTIINANGAEYASQQVLLTFDGSITKEQVIELLSQQGLAVEDVRLVSKSLEGSDVLVEVHYAGTEDPVAVAETLRDTSFVTTAGPNIIETIEETPDDTYYSLQWANEAIGTSAAWDVVKANQNVTVALIDSGVDSDHPDLAGSLVPSEYAKNTDTELYGYDAVEDESGHGTHVAGIIAATAGNAQGVAGVSYNANILPIRTTYDSSGKMRIADIIEAIDYAVTLKTAADSPAYLKNIRIINLSFGGYNYDSSGTYADAIARATKAGILVVASAGNSSTDSTHYPSAYPYALGVSSLKQGSPTTEFDDSYSNYGSYVDLSAPGTSIHSTSLGGDYGNKTGSSMATAVVSGTAALVFAKDMDATPAEVEATLEQTADDLGDAGRDDFYGHGMVRADRAVGAVPPSKKRQAITAADVELMAGASASLGARTSGDGELSYHSSDESIATVDATGTVRGVAEGTAKITISASETASYQPETTNVTVRVSAVPAPSNWKRLAGPGRYDTMAAIVQEGFAQTSDWAVVATGANFPDALVASSLAGSKACPVVLTDSNSLSDQARQELVRLGVSHAYIMGGTGAVSAEVADALTGELGIEVTRVSGTGRQGTSLAAAQLLPSPETVVIVTGDSFADALSIGPWCYRIATPILLTGGYGTLANEQLDWLATCGAQSLVVVGGTGAVPASTVDDACAALGIASEAVTRLRGADRYATSATVATWEIAQGMGVANLAVATGADFPDALAGAALCGSRSSVLTLACEDDISAVEAALEGRSTQLATGFILGGTGAVSASVMERCERLTAIS